MPPAPPHLKDKPRTTGERKAATAEAAPQPAMPVPSVYAQTSRMHKVMTAVEGEDEFSARSLQAEAWKKGPVELKPEGAREENEGGGRLLRFFRGFIR